MVMLNRQLQHQSWRLSGWIISHIGTKICTTCFMKTLYPCHETQFLDISWQQFASILTKGSRHDQQRTILFILSSCFFNSSFSFYSFNFSKTNHTFCEPAISFIIIFFPPLCLLIAVDYEYQLSHFFSIFSAFLSYSFFPYKGGTYLTTCILKWSWIVSLSISSAFNQKKIEN